VAADVSRTDVLVATTCAVAGGILTVLRASAPPGWAPAWLELVAQLAAAAALLARRRAPLLVLAACAALSFVAPVVAALAALHGVGRYVRSPRARVVGALVAVSVTWPSWLVTSAPTGPALLWGGTVVLLAAFFAGSLERSQADADERAVRAAETAARESERAALARDLHDVVAHRISYAVVEAGVIATTTHEDETRRTAGEIADGGRAALAEMRDVLHALAGPVGAPAAGTRGDDVEALAGEARRAGQPVRVRLGVPLTTPPDLVGSTVLRVVSEGLTNAVRHAPGAPTTVDVAPLDHGVEVAVRNARPAAPPTGLSTGGFGLTGLRERVGLLGGTLEAGPTPDGGFSLRALIPRGDA